jgi:hypothetical protein
MLLTRPLPNGRTLPIATPPQAARVAAANAWHFRVDVIRPWPREPQTEQRVASDFKDSTPSGHRTRRRCRNAFARGVESRNSLHRLSASLPILSVVHPPSGAKKRASSCRSTKKNQSPPGKNQARTGRPRSRPSTMSVGKSRNATSGLIKRRASAGRHASRSGCGGAANGTHRRARRSTNRAAPARWRTRRSPRLLVKNCMTPRQARLAPRTIEP